MHVHQFIDAASIYRCVCIYSKMPDLFIDACASIHRCRIYLEALRPVPPIRDMQCNAMHAKDEAMECNIIQRDTLTPDDQDG